MGHPVHSTPIASYSLHWENGESGGSLGHGPLSGNQSKSFDYNLEQIRRVSYIYNPQTNLQLTVWINSTCVIFSREPFTRSVWSKTLCKLSMIVLWNQATFSIQTKTDSSNIPQMKKWQIKAYWYALIKEINKTIEKMKSWARISTFCIPQRSYMPHISW